MLEITASIDRTRRARDHFSPSVRRHAPGPGLGRTITLVVLRLPTPLWHGLLRWWRGRGRDDDLRSLSDHALRDLGLHRSEIGSIMAEADGRAPASRRRIVAPF